MRRFASSFALMVIAACGGAPARPLGKQSEAAARSPVVPVAVAAVTPAPAPAPPPRELPLGGRVVFPDYRLVGYCGTPGGAPAMGRLSGDLKVRAKEIEALGKAYADKRKVLPVFELIVVVVQGVPGPDKQYRRRVPYSVVDTYLQAAREAKALLLLNVQPGQSDFMSEVKHFEKYLREPDVGVALDPEWAMKPKQTPGVYYGQATGTTIVEVAEFMSKLVRDDDLPEKVLVFHQMNQWVVKDEASLKAVPGVAIVKSVDGHGPRASKIITYNFLMKTMPESVHAGFKLFFQEDRAGGGRLMTSEEVLALVPQPEYVLYE